ncbi:hypothetical protein JQ615_19775 [Bradyrhizobium jicamae]|uniref:Uncharacterized protein n=1 Tax=Bradyrhizobium jicamae TaxID=280332 RepID=A0ABS5FLG3_9BRAD|nr:hypothetical protein [Bradyrhizobium jicamae]MBR0797629.1 hypothetical protein [Bradyrhizobium jicamae]
MTAIICLAKSDGIVIYTDGASLDARNGAYLNPCRKAQIFVHQPMIMAARGPMLATSLLEFACDKYTTFDAAVDAMPKCAYSAVSQAHGATKAEIGLEVFFGGWSARSRSWEAYRTWLLGDTLDKLDEGSLELTRIPFLRFAPDPGPEALEQLGVITNGALHLRSDAEIVNLMEGLRATKFYLGSHDAGTKGCVVGAFVQKTSLTANGAKAEIIHRWPDVIGKPLGVP